MEALIDPSKLLQKRVNESVSDKFRHECLKMGWFCIEAEANASARHGWSTSTPSGSSQSRAIFHNASSQRSS